MTLVRAKIDVQIPRKRKGLCSQHEKGVNRFFDTIIRAIKQHVNFDGEFSFPGAEQVLVDVLLFFVELM